MNLTFLQNHCVRRHGQTMQDIRATQPESEKDSKLTLQLAEIKQRLELAESQLSEERQVILQLSQKVSEIS